MENLLYICFVEAKTTSIGSLSDTDSLFGKRYDVVDEPNCHQWIIREWESEGVLHGHWLVYNDGKYEVELQVEGNDPIVIDRPSAEGILEWSKIKQQ